MIEFGRTLRAAREAKGYTIAQIAELTHLSPSAVEDLEKEDFSGIAAPIYGRGFVKLYCEAVGLAPKPLVDEFMEIYSGNRDTEIRERPVAPEPEPSEGEDDAPAAIPEPQGLAEPARQAASEPDLFSEPSGAAGEDARASARFSRYAAPIDQTRASSPSPFAVPPAAWRIAALAAVALALLALLLFGACALYRATRAEPPAADEAELVPAPQAAPDARKPAADAARREPQSIPALYVD